MFRIRPLSTWTFSSPGDSRESDETDRVMDIDCCRNVTAAARRALPRRQLQSANAEHAAIFCPCWMMELSQQPDFRSPSLLDKPMQTPTRVGI